MAISVWTLVEFPAKKHKISIEAIDKHRGICWVGGRQIVTIEELQKAAALGVNWISQTPFGWQRGFDNPQIGNQIGSDNGWWGERDEGLRSTTRMAKNLGIKTILKPHIWLRDDQGKWRGEIEMSSEEDWLEWFKNYETFILHYAQLAEEEQIEMLCIGTELHRTCTERELDWRILIAKIRNVYKGQLTYAANFADEYEEVAFWDDLDFIGVQGYFPVASSANPSLDEIKAGWQPHIAQLRKFSNRFEKPILFTELGYKSTKDAGITPWEWPQRLPYENRKAIFSEETQAQLYEGMFQSLYDEPFIAGFHLWKWYPYYEEGIKRFRERNPENQYVDIDFTPQGKKAESIMAKWYSAHQ
jgi:hypothetical protein